MLNPKEILAYLFHVAASDDNWHPREEDYLEYVTNELGLIPAEVEEVKANYKTYPFDPPREEYPRMITFYYILFMIRSDQVITDEEVQKAKLIGFKLGFNELMTDDLIQVMIDYAQKQLPSNIMIEKVKPYLN